MIDEGGDVIVREQRDSSSPPILSGPGQTMRAETYVKQFAEFMNSDNPARMMSELFCSLPSVRFLDLSPEDQLDYIHKLDECVKIIKVYQQSAEVNYRDKIESLDFEEKKALRAKDAAYKVKPRIEDEEKRDKETKQQKLVKMLRSSGLTEEQIIKLVHGNK